jgi:hypothetical protein
VSLIIRSAVILLCLAGCSTHSKTDFSGLIAQLTPARWQHPGTWDFRVVDQQKQSIGHLVLRLTGESVSNTACDDGEWKTAVILEDRLDYDFGFDLQPAYRVHGRWLTVDLTASMCNVDHIFNGEVDDDGASGFFNYYHRLGGNNIGAFTAVPVTQ